MTTSVDLDSSAIKMAQTRVGFSQHFALHKNWRCWSIPKRSLIPVERSYFPTKWAFYEPYFNFIKPFKNLISKVNSITL